MTALMMYDETPSPTPTIHLGAPTQVAGLSIFPAWTDQPVPRRAVRTVLPDRATITELPDGPVVDKLLLTNPTEFVFLVLEGLLVAGGWQHRVVTHSWLAGPHDEFVLDVRCVEQGRWNGDHGHGVDRRRVPVSIRGALRETAGPRIADRRVDQGTVWSRVERYEASFGSSPTSSLVDVMDTTLDPAAYEALPKALPGQRGVLVGVAGHPVLLELFDHPRTLATQLAPLLEGMLLDGLRQPWVATSGRRARAFARAASTRVLEPVEQAGAGVLVAGRDDLADMRGVFDHRNRLVHAAAVNVRHTLVAA
jgi:ARG and Rhodanese-Phosphatase-superfamily-associated Protein domain